MAKKIDIDLGLSVLCALADEGETLTLDAIAEVCNCRRNAIWMAERKALAKLRQRLQHLGGLIGDDPRPQIDHVTEHLTFAGERL
ncbi:Uncharacterised protein [BD1-7 clade bacterium]|uniref:Uncharacterized protein n=1 Tax=BD1-7 clade bacterium TaxID=2029982 RepID=A0A5S9Q4B9_9GAMM|nr:Uncharacterised protein [BD1-7 clade bacterium]CAA0111815.1 Uncharacterised protein [BD1-7 clade bacterium]